MKILIDGRQLRTSTGRYVERLLHYLQDLDDEHEYIVLLKPEDIDGWQPKSERFQKETCPHKEYTFAEQFGLLRQINSHSPDLVHFPMVQQPVFYRGKVVTTMNDLTTTRFLDPSKNRLVYLAKQQVYKWLNKRVAKKSSAIITYTDFVRRDIIDYTHVGEDKFTVTNLAADPILDAPVAVEGLSGMQFLMYVGRPMPHKNLDRLVAAFAELRKTHPDLLLVLAGKMDANYKMLENQVHQQNIEGVVFTDFIDDAQLRWLYENCQAYVFPSLSEGFGLPGLEAMLHGAPVVSSNATCLPEVYGNAAHYFDPLDVEDMVRAISDVLSDEKLHAELVAKGHKQVKKYSWQRMAQQTLTVYNGVLE